MSNSTSDNSGYSLPQLVAFILAFGSLLTAPLWGPNHLFILTVAVIWAILAMGWDVLSGYTGYISFGHSILVAAGAYTSGIILTQMDLGIPIWAIVIISISAAIVVGMLFALPSLRLQGPYFSLVTLVVVLIGLGLVRVFNQYTGGQQGLIGIPPLVSYDPVEQYYTALIPMLVIALALTYIGRSNIGMILVAIRENEESVEEAGISTTKFKLFAFIISTIPTAIGGILLTHFYGQVTPPTVLALARSIEMIAMVIIGGIGTIVGPLFGGVLFIVLDNIIVDNLVGSDYTNIVMWTLVLLVLVMYPQGVVIKVWNLLGKLGPTYDVPRLLDRGENE